MNEWRGPRGDTTAGVQFAGGLPRDVLNKVNGTSLTGCGVAGTLETSRLAWGACDGSG
jgi:hypothetical protein